MATSRKVIVTCAVTGAIHTPSMSPFLPVTAQEISDSAVGAVDAGAAIIHLHARDPDNGQPVQTIEEFMKFLPDIRARCNGIINITTGGAPTMAVDMRMRPAMELKPELASLNMGSMNFGLFPMLGRYKEFKHAWEQPYLAGTTELIFRNTFGDIEFALKAGADNGTRFEFECYDTAHLYNLAHFLDRGLIQTPFLVQTVFGILGGIGSHPDDVSHLKRTADRLFGHEYLWSVLGAGRSQMPLASLAAAQGGHVRVGLEDSLWDGPGILAKTNAEQVRRACGIIRSLGLEPATPDEVRAMLGLKGQHGLSF